ncbi:MAG: molybdenum cofactor biosynthesis protein MoaE [Gammaproteobacteria bacterium]
MKAEVRIQAFDPWAELSAYQQSLAVRKGGFGATAVFVGTMRDFNQDTAVAAMTLEHYPGMTEKHLESIAHEAKSRWAILDTLILHRVGQLQPHEPIVLCAVWSAHRHAAFAACRFLIEELKSRAPFWKKEQTESGERWVEHNAAG